jgi:sugar O-acyltransferase (sialic acid O-acetyltransferase NeuD family)
VTPTRIAVIGAGGHAKVVIATAEAAGFAIAAVFDDREELWGRTVLGYPVAGPIEAMEAHDVDRAVPAIGSNSGRRDVTARVATNWVTVVHPGAHVHRSVVIGVGTVVFAGAVLQPDTTIGEHSIINTGASVDHDCVIGDFCHLAPGSHLAGNVRLGQGCLLGVGASLIPGVTVGAWSVIGAGAAIVSDVPAGVTYAGVPGRPVGRKQ